MTFWRGTGRQLAFAKDGNVYLAYADGSDVRGLLTTAKSIYGIHFSPESARIRLDLVNLNDISRSIWEVRTDGTNLHPLLPGWRNASSACCGVWSPDGRYFFFLVLHGPVLGWNVLWTFGGDIWALQESTSAFRKYPSRLFQLTTGPMLFGAIRPRPDGKKLFAEGRKGRGELIRYDERRHEFVPFFGGIWAGDLSFSRDGKWVAYVSYPEATLWRSRVDGSDRLQLTYPPVVAGLPRWSPDGTQIAFMDLQVGRPFKVLLISAQGGAAQEVLSENVFQLDPGWSPDGKQMIFNSRPELGHPETYNIQLLDLNSKQVSIIPGSQGLTGPRWSPDGQYIAAHTFDGKKVALCLANCYAGRFHAFSPCECERNCWSVQAAVG
jgi:Tol biopolymer transport system component